MLMQKKLSICVVSGAVVLAGWTSTTWVHATETVILNPAQISGQVSFGAETLTSLTVFADSIDGLHSEGTFTTSPYSLTVESGHDYRPGITAWFSNPTTTSGQTYLQVYRSGALSVSSLASTTANFNYSNTRHVDFSINVTGGYVRSYYLYTSASPGTGESYQGYTSGSSSLQPSTISTWSAMVPLDGVTAWGTVYLAAADGTQSTRSLSQQIVNLLQGQSGASWAIDLTDKGTLGGDVAFTSVASASSHQVYFQGVYGTSAQGVSGSKQVSANGSYAIDLPPGQYDVYLRSNFPSQNSTSDTRSYRVTVASGAASTQDFVDTLSLGQVPWVVKGFFSSDDLSWARSELRRKDPSPGLQTQAYSDMPANGQFGFSLTSGEWRRSSVQLELQDYSNPQLPLNVDYYRYYYNDEDVLPVTASAGFPVYLGAEEVTLVKSNIYFDVQEATSLAPEILLSSPYVTGYQYEYDDGSSLKKYKRFYAWGSSEARAKSAFTVVAEPGTYVMRAYATVNGTQTQFSSHAITFATPVTTVAGSDVPVTLLTDASLQVGVTFPEVTTTGITTVVETPLGPEPPEGFKAICSADESNPDGECEPSYYDIKTTAVFPKGAGAPRVKVCVRRKFTGSNALIEFLHLHHYDETLGQWEELEAPPGMDPATVCDGDNLAVCGCADEASCGINYYAEPPESVIMVCGMTSGFSPFGVFKGAIEFTNVVDGQAYEGPTGPPSLQSWKVPEDGTYRLTTTGARGASATQAAGITGGCGAQIAGDFPLQKDDVLQILVGQKGTAAPSSGGGGGGSFVVLNNTPLIIAGGGGGARAGALVNGRSGSVGTAGTDGAVSASYLSGFVAGGVNGLGGSKASGYGSGGGGWLGNGVSDGAYGEGGFSFASSLIGGKGGAGKSCGALASGGYGGGGAGNGCYGGGGGGGYSGGGGGRVAGGGGSLNTGAHPRNVENACTTSGHGRVQIEYIGQ
jgi:hypothetical protein